MSNDLKQLAQQDVDATKLFCGLANRAISQAVMGHELQGVVVARLQQHAELRIVAKDPYTLRVDAYSEAMKREVTYYLTQARASLADQQPQLITWTAPLSQLRHGDIGETIEISVPAGTREYTIRGKGRYGRSAPTPKDVLYDIEGRQVRIADLIEFLRTPPTPPVSTPSPVPSPSPQLPPVQESVAPTHRQPREFGLSQIIFETDRTQDSALRFPMTGHVLIEGAPGSGKTTVALQRIPYLLDQQHEVLNLPRDQVYFSEDTTVVFVLSEVLDQYLESLLADLRVRVRICPVPNFIQQEVRSRADLSGTRRRPRNESSQELILKTRSEVLEKLRSVFVLVLRDEVPRAITEIQKRLENIMPGAAYRRLRIEVLQPLTDFLNGLGRAATSLAQPISEILDILDNWRQRRDAPDSGERERVWSAVTEVLKTVGEPLTVLSTFVDSDIAKTYAEALASGDGLRSSAKYLTALRAWRRALKARWLTQHDFSLLAWLTYWRAADGFDRSHRGAAWVKGWPRFRHIVIDEVQDLTEVECRLLVELAENRYNCVTAVGDLAQRINWPAGLESWERGGLHLSGEAGRRGVFKVNYRQTQQLARCAILFHQLAFGKAPLFDASSREGMRAPRLYFASSPKRRFSIAAKEIARMLDDVPRRTVAVLIDNDDERDAAFRYLKKSLHGTADCRLSHAADLKRAGIVHVTSSQAVKGLEFDAVVVLVSNAVGTRTAIGALNRQYVAITRACEDLAVIVSRNAGVWKGLATVFSVTKPVFKSETPKRKSKVKRTGIPHQKKRSTP